MNINDIVTFLLWLLIGAGVALMWLSLVGLILNASSIRRNAAYERAHYMLLALAATAINAVTQAAKDGDLRNKADHRSCVIAFMELASAMGVKVNATQADIIVRSARLKQPWEHDYVEPDAEVA